MTLSLLFGSANNKVMFILKVTPNQMQYWLNEIGRVRTLFRIIKTPLNLQKKGIFSATIRIF